MTTQSSRSLEDIEQTDWAKEFKNDSPVSYPVALRYAQQDELEVFIEHTRDGSGDMMWAVCVLDDPSFYMDFKATEEQAISLCQTMGWKIV